MAEEEGGDEQQLELTIGRHAKFLQRTLHVDAAVARDVHPRAARRVRAQVGPLRVVGVRQRRRLADLHQVGLQPQRLRASEREKAKMR